MIDRQSLMVLEDALEERGWQRHPREPGFNAHLPDTWRFTRGGIAEGRLNWYDGPRFAQLNVGYDGSATRLRPSLRSWHPTAFREILRTVEEVEALVSQIDASEIPVTPDVPRGMHRPLDLSPSGSLAYDLLLQFLVDQQLTFTGGGTTFWHPQEWARRGHGGERAELVVVYEGGDAQLAMSMDGDEDLHDEMQDLLRQHGLYFEEANSHSGAVYRR